MSDFKTKMHQIRFQLGSEPDLSGAYSAPQYSLAYATSKGREGERREGKEGEKEGRVEEGREGCRRRWI